MIDFNYQSTRRTFILAIGALSAAAAVRTHRLWGENTGPVARTIPSSGERIPVIGMGTWETFDVGDDSAARAQLAEVLKAFFEKGGRLIDSSPMYGTAESVVGDLLKAAGRTEDVFAATKVWTDGRQSGVQQMEDSIRRMRVPVLDLMQIHNLRDWQTHLPVMKDWKQRGRFRYIGITTSHGRYHPELERILRSEPFDFVQFTYNIEDRAVEQRLLPLAAERGIATLINRPFQGGSLFRKVKEVSLPQWSSDFNCSSWGQFFLKFIVSHPAVTCVIPATSKIRHMEDNMGAGFGRLPDENQRKRMLQHYESL